jgi:5-hmdU DNA kinase, helical domain
MTTNPYRDALNGLEIADPVQAFFDWCKEREAIRIRREAGQPPPWSSDPIFQQGRFLNVFREDDRGTKAVLRFAAPVQDSPRDLIHALFFARWCNQAVTLNALRPELLNDSSQLRHTLLHEIPPPWASEVYPVVPAQWEGRSYDRLEACIELFPRCLDFLVDCIQQAKGNVMEATNAIQTQFQMSNDFPLFMALVDLALFCPDLISPNSPVPTGIGAAPFMDRLQAHLNCPDHQAAAEEMIRLQPKYWPDAKRAFTPIDIEYLSCECRKYYSYVNGTKAFEGKNRFVPAS